MKALPVEAEHFMHAALHLSCEFRAVGASTGVTRKAPAPSMILIATKA
jgi:hypothetical protein